MQIAERMAKEKLRTLAYVLTTLAHRLKDKAKDVENQQLTTIFRQSMSDVEDVVIEARKQCNQIDRDYPADLAVPIEPPVISPDEIPFGSGLDTSDGATKVVRVTPAKRV